ncbi:MAG TPA: hypothetical protein VM715_04945, partial [Candidatus Acidoferrum sp.]|nr:hypothetical protein [Candidatus Acidoferrum sp.]
MSQFEPFNRHRLNFSSDGMLDQLRQFKEGLAQFIISEIVLGKLHAHLTLRGERGRCLTLRKRAESSRRRRRFRDAGHLRQLDLKERVRVVTPLFAAAAPRRKARALP